jgi:hypothetical protein
MPGRGRSFQKGQSGNPGGKARKTAEIEALAQEHAPAAIAALVEALNGKDRVQAAALLLAYAFGKPRQHLEHSGEMAQRYVVYAPPPVESAEEWIKTYAPKEAHPPAAAAGSGPPVPIRTQERVEAPALARAA